MNDINTICKEKVTIEPLTEWWREWRRLHWNLTLLVDLLHLNIKRQEVSILLTFTLSEHVHSSWVISKSFHDLAPLDIFSFNSLLLPNPMVQSYWPSQNSLLWHVFVDLFVIAHAILFVTNPPVFFFFLLSFLGICLNYSFKWEELCSHVNLHEVPYLMDRCFCFRPQSHHCS